MATTTPAEPRSTYMAFGQLRQIFSSSDELIVGSDEDDWLDGNWGNDTIYGGKGNDSIIGRGETGYIEGGEGDDHLISYAGGHTLKGGAGVEKYQAALKGHDVIEDFDAAAGEQLLLGVGIKSIDVLVVEQSGDDIVIDLAGYGRGKVTLKNVKFEDLTTDNFGRENHQTVKSIALAEAEPPESETPPAETQPTHTMPEPLAGNGPVNHTGTHGADMIAGGGGADRLKGKKGDDIINGGAGDDFISAGRGDDLIAGGEGNDTFWYGLAGAGDDTITDFTADEDRIDLRKFKLTWEELLAATEDDGNGNTVISLAHPSKPAKDASILLEGVVEADLGAGDFLL